MLKQILRQLIPTIEYHKVNSSGFEYIEYSDGNMAFYTDIFNCCKIDKTQKMLSIVNQNKNVIFQDRMLFSKYYFIIDNNIIEDNKKLIKIIRK